MVAWGDNGYGQATVPAGLSGVIAVAGGGSHSLALKADGTVVAWGDVPARVTCPGGLRRSGGRGRRLYHSLALKANGSVVAWGDNSAGECNVPYLGAGRPILGPLLLLMLD